MPLGSQIEIEIPLSAALNKAYGTDFGTGNEGERHAIVAEVTDIQPPLSAPSRMRTIKLEIDNSSGLLEAKAYRDLRARARQPVRCLTVPIEALLLKKLEDERDSVLVCRDDGTVEMREVICFIDDGEKYAGIRSGLKEGEIVITSEDAPFGKDVKVSVSLEGDEK